MYITDGHLKDAMEEWRENGITKESFHNNKFKDIIKTYKQYKDFAIDYREHAGAPCPAFEDYSTASLDGIIIIKPTDFAEEIESLYNPNHKVNSLSYIAFQKLLSSSNNLKITWDNNVALSTDANDKKYQLHIKYSIKKQEIESVCFYFPTPNLTEITWDNSNSKSILANLFETELTGDIS